VPQASPLAFSEWLAIAFGAAFVASLFALPWFGFSLDGNVVPGSTGDAFRWLHGLDLVLLLVGLIGLGATFLRLLGPVRPGILLAGTLAGIVAFLLIVGLMIWPPDGGEAVFGAFGGNPAGEIVPQRGALVGLVAAVGIIVTGWLGIGRRMAEVAAARTLHAPVVAEVEPAAQDPTASKRPAQPKDKPKPKPKPASSAKPRRRASSTTKPKAAAAKPKAPRSTKTKPATHKSKASAAAKSKPANAAKRTPKTGPAKPKSATTKTRPATPRRKSASKRPPSKS